MGRRVRATGPVVRAAIAVVGAVLLAAGCSGSGDDDEIEGVESAGEQSPSPTDDAAEETAPEDDGIERPDIQVAEDLEMVFEDRETGDPTQDAILRDNEWQILSVYEVFTTYDRENSSVGFYTAGTALTEALTLLDNVIARGETSAGTMRYYNRQAEVLSEGVATVTYCRDYSEVYTKNFETGEVVEEADADAEPTRYEAGLELNELGVWQTVNQVSEPGGAGC